MSIFINNAQIMIGDTVIIDFSHVVNNHGNAPTRLVMTYECFKNIHAAMNEIIDKTDTAIAEKKKAN